jgi:hypothetical protein
VQIILRPPGMAASAGLGIAGLTAVIFRRFLAFAIE